MPDHVPPFRVPLSVLDLVPIASGSGPAEALRNTVDLARAAEAFGYRRYWFAEHHLNPGVAGTAPPILITLVGGATSTIRLGSGGMQLGHRTALSVVEEFGLLDAAFPGRIDLGLGRSAGRPPAATPVAAGAAAGGPASNGEAPKPLPRRKATTGPGGLLIPPPFDFSRLLASPRLALQTELLRPPGAETPNYTEQVGDILKLLAGSYRASNGVPARIVPGEGAGVQVWILGSSAGESAAVAGARGLPFAANYHVAPAGVLDAAQAYRDAFRPSPAFERPHVIVSADVVVADDDATAQRLAAGFGMWVRSIRTGEGAIPYPTADEVEAHLWTEDDRALVADRIDTQFVGSPATVVEKLRVLRDATEADELLITTMTHDHADRVRSYELLAQAWNGGSDPAP